MNNDKTIKLIKQTIKKLRPYLNADGGDLDFVKFEDGIVKTIDWYLANPDWLK